MQYVFLIRSSAGCKKYVTRRSRVTYFLQPARERIKNTYCMDKRPFLFLLLIYMRFLTIVYARKHGTLLYCGLRQWASLSMGRVLKYSQTDGIDELFSVILRLNVHEILAFVYIFVEQTLPGQLPIPNRVLHKRQRKLIDVIDRDVKIFLTTYFRTTPVSDVNFTSLVTSLITCHHCVSFTVALVICKWQLILKWFTSLVAQRVFNSMMQIIKPANRGLACRVPCIPCCQS